MRCGGIEAWMVGDGAHRRGLSTATSTSNLSIPAMLQWPGLDKWQWGVEREAAGSLLGWLMRGEEKSGVWSLGVFW
jgi:hypothetical protein